MGIFGGASVLVVLFLVFVGFLWILMPFAIFGTKDLISAQVAEQKKTNELLQQIANNTKPKAE